MSNFIFRPTATPYQPIVRKPTLQEAMRQREAKWQAKTAAKGVDDAVCWTKKPQSNANEENVLPNTQTAEQNMVDSWLSKSGNEQHAYSHLSFQYPMPETLAVLNDRYAGLSSDTKQRTKPTVDHQKMNTGKFAICDHCASHGLPCNMDSVCAQCIYHGVACVRRWCKRSKASKANCPNLRCHFVHKDDMPKSEYLQGLKWLVIPGKPASHLSAERKGRLCGKFERIMADLESVILYKGQEYDRDEDVCMEEIEMGGWYCDVESLEILSVEALLSECRKTRKNVQQFLDRYSKKACQSALEVDNIKRIQAKALAYLDACVSSGKASWDTVRLTCDCIVFTPEEDEAWRRKETARMASIRRDVPYLVRYK
ncbi:hypothetical protein LTR22_023329 [Elasticomyces elasticus]|nr:hypothetical protein LTR22_023329 [Elasticomyces elasticus]KAK4926749.1 hypothetical protein LTR49_006431 [Elasticomyces elasticus]KAK5762300.1 hypothetical protein LTS12_007459 [Elasticomyces elasticus]